MSFVGNLKDKKNPWRYWLRKSPQVILWIILIFAFKHDIYRDDFRFIPFPAVIVLSLLAFFNLRDIILQYILKVELKKLKSFSEWIEYKQAKK